MINEIENLKELLRDAHVAAEELRCNLRDYPALIPQADRVLTLIQLASFRANDHACHCEKAKPE